MVDQAAAASSPDTGSDGLDAAINAAFEGMDESDFHSVAGKATEDKPQEVSSTEPAPEGKSPEAAAKDAGKPKPPTKAAQAPTSLDAPAHWDAPKKEKYGKLTPEAKALFMEFHAEQERGWTEKTTKAADKVKFADSVSGLISQEHREQLERAGLNEIEGFRRLLQYQDYALKKPDAYAKWFLQSAGLDPRQVWSELFTGGQQQPGNGQAPPQAQPAPARPQLDPQIVKRLETVDHLANWVQQYEANNVIGVITRFRAAKDAEGNPLHPHIDRVSDAMAKLIETHPDIKHISDQSEQLQRAYNAAVYADPELRQQIFDAELSKRTAEQTRAAEVAKAKRAKPPLSSPAPVAGPTPGGKQSLDDIISRSMQEFGL